MQDRLFQLIGSMSRTEKAHFRKFGFKTQDGGANERVLFDIVSDALKKHPQDPQIFVKDAYTRTGRNDLARMRTRLFDALLHSIADHDRHRHDVNQFAQLIVHARTLTERGMINEARKLLDKGSDLAAEQQKPHWQLIFSREKSAIETRHGTHDSILRSLEEQLAAIRQTHQLTKLAMLYENAFHLQRTLGQKREDQPLLSEKLKELETEADAIDLTDAMPAARFNRLMLGQIIAHTLNDTDRTLDYSEQAYQLVQEHPEMTIGRTKLPVALLANLINDGLSEFNFTYYDRYMDELRQWADRDKNLKDYTIGQVFRTEASAALHGLQFNQWEPLMKRLSILRSEQLLSHIRWAIFGQLTHMMFADCAYKECIREISSSMKQAEVQQRQDLHTTLELLLTACHFELGNYDIVEQIASSMRQRKSLREQFSTSESVFVQCIHAMATKPEAEHQNIAQAILKKFATEADQQPFGFFNPQVWIEAKATATPYIDRLVQHYEIDPSIMERTRPL